MKRRILSISYDRSLLETRQMLLESAGYSVTSAHAFVNGYQECCQGKYDLILMGHSMPREDKTVLVAAIRKNGNAPVLSIRRHGDAPLTGAEYSIDCDEGPVALLAMIETALETSPNS
jgi:DNA-binding response OmpR family regulator